MFNEDQLVETLEKKGFKEVFTENMSMLEKIIIFSNAKSIIGAIGGGLANILFCNKDVKLTVIVSPTFLDINKRFIHCFKNINNVYYFFDCKHIEKTYFKKYMRVLTNDNTVGEIINIEKDRAIICFSKQRISGWNNLVTYETSSHYLKDLHALDCGLNSNWEINLENLSI
jgi:hypothetical protein